MPASRAQPATSAYDSATASRGRRPARRLARRLRAHLTPGTRATSRTTASPARTTGLSSRLRLVSAPASGSELSTGWGSGARVAGLVVPVGPEVDGRVAVPSSPAGTRPAGVV